MDFSYQKLKKFPTVLCEYESINCDSNKFRYIPENLKLRYFGFMHNRVKRLPNLLFVDRLGTIGNKIKDRSWRVYLCGYNKYYNYLCNIYKN
jgi:hypothetical protein